MVSSHAVVSRAESSIPWFVQPGIYFLVKDGKVAYVGQSDCIGYRLQQHFEDKAPSAVSVILGIPKWAQTTIEYAYIKAWRPAWNREFSRGPAGGVYPWLMALADSLDRSAVLRP